MIKWHFQRRWITSSTAPHLQYKFKRFAEQSKNNASDITYALFIKTAAARCTNLCLGMRQVSQSDFKVSLFLILWGVIANFGRRLTSSFSALCRSRHSSVMWLKSTLFMGTLMSPMASCLEKRSKSYTVITSVFPPSSTYGTWSRKRQSIYGSPRWGWLYLFNNVKSPEPDIISGLYNS